MESKELDALVAVKVMGFYWEGKPRGHQYLYQPGGKQAGIKERGKEPCYFGNSQFGKPYLPDYSTSISDAWLVVEEMRGRGLDVRVESFQQDEGVVIWEAEVGDKWSDCDTAPEAICMAALEVCRT